MEKKAVMLALLAASAAAVGATNIVPRHIAPLMPALAQSVGSQPGPVQLLPEANVQPAPAYQPQAYSMSPNVSQALVQWSSLRQTDRLPFSSYASFLTRYRGWPGEAGLRRSAERAIDPNNAPGEVAAYFRVHPPLTNTGRARHAFALHGTGQVDAARAAAREAWRSGDLLRPDEDRLLALFSASLTAEDHDVRIAALLDAGQVANAQRLLGWASPARRPFHETRIAIQSRAADADSRLAMLGAAANADAGILMDRANALRNSSQSATARALLARSRALTARPVDVEKWFETLVVMARGAASDRNWSTAYQIASQIDDAYPAGTDVSDRSYGERDEYTNLAWLAGTAALQQLGRPADAVGMFERYAHAARSSQTQSKGFYWAGRAAAQAGQAERANGYFAQAAAFPDQYYGQLAIERLGQTIAPPLAATVPSSAARAAFARNELAAATRLLGQMGRREDQTIFVRALSESLKTDEERQLAAEMGRQIGRPDLGVWVARSARTGGDTFYTRDGFPEINVSPAYGGHWTLSHAITRQESSFDRTAVSHAGARGMMQLMPGTAGETARKLGLDYSRERLTADPGYNIMLGSAFFGTLMDRYGGFAPLAVAAYNAGPGNVNKWLAANGDPRMPGVDVVRWVEEIPFTETRNYVQRVLENAVVYDAMHPARSRSPERNRLSYYLGKSSRPG